MPENLLFSLTFVSALGSGLIAGTFFAFSTFVMKSLGKLPPSQGIVTMQQINIIVINPWFMFIFLGTVLTCLAVAVWAIVGWQRAGSGWLLAGALLYVVGTFGVTIAFNVPRNNALAAVDANTAEAATLWADYLTTWTAWNTVRTIGGLAAMAALIMAMVSSKTPA